MITIDGVMQAPGGPEEDTSGGFEYGGWVAPFGDEEYGKVMQEQMKPADILLGRKTFDILKSIGQNTLMVGRELMKLPNTFCPPPENTLIGKTQNFSQL